MEKLIIVRYHVYKNKRKTKSFRYLKKATQFAEATRAEAIDKEIVRNRHQYSVSHLIPYFVEYKW